MNAKKKKKTNVTGSGPDFDPKRIEKTFEKLVSRDIKLHFQNGFFFFFVCLPFKLLNTPIISTCLYLFITTPESQ